MDGINHLTLSIKVQHGHFLPDLILAAIMQVIERLRKYGSSN